MSVDRPMLSCLLSLFVSFQSAHYFAKRLIKVHPGMAGDLSLEPGILGKLNPRNIRRITSMTTPAGDASTLLKRNLK